MAKTVEELEKKKVCVDCGIDKPYNEYHKKTKGGKRTVQSRCIPCMSEYKKKRYWANRDVELAKLTKSRQKPENVLQRKEYYNKNKEEYKERYKRYTQDEEKRNRRKETSKNGYLKNRDKIREKHKTNSQKPETKGKRRERHNIRKNTDVGYNIKRRLRFRLRNVLTQLKGSNFKSKSAIGLLGCDIKFFKEYIESKFTDGMSWTKFPEIHIDHIKPCSLFDLTKESEQIKCFHYTNLQPLWASENLSKNNRYVENNTRARRAA